MDILNEQHNLLFSIHWINIQTKNNLEIFGSNLKKVKRKVKKIRRKIRGRDYDDSEHSFEAVGNYVFSISCNHLYNQVIFIEESESIKKEIENKSNSVR